MIEPGVYIELDSSGAWQLVSRSAAGERHPLGGRSYPDFDRVMRAAVEMFPNARIRLDITPPNVRMPFNASKTG